MRKPETISLKEHQKIVAAKDALITELANLVDEFTLSFSDLMTDYRPLAERGKKAIARRGVSSVAWLKDKRSR
jgi:hypothetical protein